MKGRNIADLNDFNIDVNKQMKEERKKKETATLKKIYMVRMGRQDGSFKRPVWPVWQKIRINDPVSLKE